MSLSSAAPTEGTVTLTLAANSVSDGTSIGPTAATAGPVVHIDRTAPHAVDHPAGDPTKAPTLTATLSFDEGIMGLAAGDLSVTGTASRLLDRGPDRRARQQVLHGPGQRLRRGHCAP